MQKEELHLIIKEGEGLRAEFKEHYSSKIDKDIVAFANSKGGYLILGVDDNGKITGEILTNKLKAEIIDLYPSHFKMRTMGNAKFENYQ